MTEQCGTAGTRTLRECGWRGGVLNKNKAVWADAGDFVGRVN